MAGVKVNVGGSELDASPFVNVGGVWQPAQTYANTGGTWVEVFEGLDPDLVMEFNTLLGDTTVEVPIGQSGSPNFEMPNCTIDWGDGTQSTATSSGMVVHTYSSHGTYTVRISGRVPALGNNAGSSNRRTDRPELVKCLSFGVGLGLVDLSGAFRNCPNLTTIPTALPPGVLRLKAMFQDSGSLSLNWDAVSTWDVSSAESLAELFAEQSTFNVDISGWDVSNVKYFSEMFFQASSFNQNIGNWNTSSAIEMGGMFELATSFNQNIGGWNVSNVQDFANMFQDAIAFNQDIGGWDTSGLVGYPTSIALSTRPMRNMFRDATSFNQDLSGWCVSTVPEMPDRFDDGATSWTLPRPVWGTCP